MQVQKVHTLYHAVKKYAADRVKGAFKHVKMLSRGKLPPTQ